MDKSTLLEAILFFKAEPVKKQSLSGIMNIPVEDVGKLAERLAEALKNRGVRLLETDDSLELRSAPEASEIIAGLLAEEETRDLSGAALETLSIVLYKGPISRSEVDYMRGVQSQAILRSLSIRGLIEKREDEKSRKIFYNATTELLAHLGITKANELPEYSEIRKTLQE
jgi:segregation and condensation protein B